MKGRKTPKVLTVGPDMEARGGIASVLKVYSRHIPGFTFLPTNSRHGSAAGAVNLVVSLLRLPFYRFWGYRILHAHGARGKSYVRKKLVIRWARLFGFKTIYHCHAGGFPAYAREIGERRVSDFLNSCSAVAVLSEGWKKYYVETLACRNVHVVNNIIEVPGQLSPKPMSGKDCLRLLFLGRICRDKGYYELLDAMEMLRKKYLGRLRLTIGGDAPASVVNRELERRGLSGMVDYAGWVSGEKKDALFGECDIVVLPSYFEGIPISLLEAGAYCMPSIATAVGGIPEIIEDGVNGTLVPAADAGALANAVELYLKEPALVAAQGQEARRRIKKFLPDSVAEDLRNLYESLS